MNLNMINISDRGLQSNIYQQNELISGVDMGINTSNFKRSDGFIQALLPGQILPMNQQSLAIEPDNSYEVSPQSLSHIQMPLSVPQYNQEIRLPIYGIPIQNSSQSIDLRAYAPKQNHIILDQNQIGNQYIILDPNQQQLRQNQLQIQPRTYHQVFSRDIGNSPQLIQSIHAPIHSNGTIPINSQNFQISANLGTQIANQYEIQGLPVTINALSKKVEGNMFSTQQESNINRWKQADDSYEIQKAQKKIQNSKFAVNTKIKKRKSTPQTGDLSKFTINEEEVMSGLESRTTIMVRNIPNGYAREALINELDPFIQNLYDFIYLPMDVSHFSNLGYAFINFKDPKSIIPFYYHFQGRIWDKFKSGKICDIKYARIQGIGALEKHFEGSHIAAHYESFRPVFKAGNGSYQDDTDGNQSPNSFE